MEQIEQALGKRIIRIETKNLDEMEEVRLAPSLKWVTTHSLYTDHEKGPEMRVIKSPFSLRIVILVQQFCFTYRVFMEMSRMKQFYYGVDNISE
jgi:hypothetical protein